MVKMAEPYQHPETGMFYLRRQIPVALRSEFEGKQLWKRSLGTKDSRAAARKFTAANFELERLFDAAKLAIAERASRDVLTAERAGALIARRSSAISGERFPLLSNIYWSEEAAASIVTDFVAVPMFTDSSPDGIAKLNPEHLPGELWLRVVRTRSRAEALFMAEHMILWAMGQFGSHNPSVDVFARGPVNDAAVLIALTAAVEKEVGDLRVAVRSPIVSMKTRLRPDMRLGQLFTEWKDKTKAPGLQCVHETKTTIDDFITFAGDMPVALLSGDHLYNFRDAVSSLPKAMPRMDRALPFNDRVRKYRDHDLAPISPGSVKRRIGHLQALVTYAFSQRWIAANSGSAITIEGYEKNTGNRRPLLDDELSRLFACRLFTQPTTWTTTRSTVSDATLAWLFLLGLTSGARIEEIGQTELANIKVDGGVWYFDLGPESRVKTKSSRRMIPLHAFMMQLGFDRYVEALKQSGQLRLFPDLLANQFEKVSKEASRRANRIIDRAIGKDSVITFHSQRHNFKDLARDKLIEKYVIDQLTGHAGVTAGDKYGIGARLSTLKHELDRIRFEMIDWAPILKAFENLDWNDLVHGYAGK